MRTAFASGTIGLLGFAVLAIRFADDRHLVAPTAIFWLVVIAASLCVATSLAVAALAVRLRQSELGIISAFFFSASVLPLVHGLTIPGVLYGNNTVTMTSVFLAIPVGLVAAWIVGLAARPGRPGRPVHHWPIALAATFVVSLGLGALLLVEPQINVHPEPGSVPGIAAALASFGATFWLASRHVRLAMIAERPAPMVVAAGYVLVGASALVFLGASMWSTYFWIAHVVDISGVFLATIGALIVYSRRGSIFAVMAPVTAIDSRAAFEYGLAPVVHRFVADLETKDRITRDHVVRTGALAIDVACALELDAETVRRAGMVGLLHDIGKLDIPDAILAKPGALSNAEFDVMKTHARKGAELAAATSVIADLAPAIGAHHERPDGRGYPDGLSAESIPMEARIVSACDAYDAMSCTRHYRSGMDAEKVRAILREHAGAQWDAGVVAALLRVVDGRCEADVWALDGVGTTAAVGSDLPPRIGCDCASTHAVV